MGRIGGQNWLLELVTRIGGQHRWPESMAILVARIGGQNWLLKLVARIIGQNWWPALVAKLGG